MFIRAIVLALFMLGPGAMGRAQDLAITRATVYSAPDAPARTDVTVVIRHGVIAGVGEHLRIPKDIETISCQGCVVLAGFWNAHVHFMEPQWNEAAHQPADKLARQMSEMLTHSGFTTVVDTGSDSICPVNFPAVSSNGLQLRELLLPILILSLPMNQQGILTRRPPTRFLRCLRK